MHSQLRAFAGFSPVHGVAVAHLALSPSGHSEPSSQVHVWGLEQLVLSPFGHSEPSSHVHV